MSELRRIEEALEIYRGYMESGRFDSPGSFDLLLANHPDHADLLRPMESVDPSDSHGANSRSEPWSDVPEVGCQVGGFELIELLGAGGQGEVWLARGPGRARIALKIYYGAAREEASRLRRFEQEVRIARGLDHRGLSGVLDSGEWHGRPWIAFSFVDGIELRELIEQRESAPRSVAEARPWVRVARDVARALAYVHGHSLVHRDVKPSNILLAAESGRQGFLDNMERTLEADSSRAILVDFGIARPMDQERRTLTGVPVGSTHYMAPEQALGKAELDGRADVFSLGVTLFRCLADRLPFSATSLAEYQRMLERKEDCSVRPISEATDSALGTVLQRALAIDPNDRYVSAESFAEDLDRWLEGRPILARPIPAWKRAIRWVRGHPGWATAAALLLVTIGSLAWSGFEVVRAAQSERDSRFVEALTLAESAASEGRWELAHETLDRAASLGGANPAVEVARIGVWHAQLEFDRARGALARLQEQGDLGEYSDVVELLWFDPTDPAGSGSSTSGWREVYRRLRSSEHLDAHWHHYIDACLAESLPDCRRSIEAAVRANSRHRASQELRYSLLLLSGSRSEAIDCATSFLTIWPDDPLGSALLGLALGLSGQADDIRSEAAKAGSLQGQVAAQVRELQVCQEHTRSLGRGVLDYCINSVIDADRAGPLQLFKLGVGSRMATKLIAQTMSELAPQEGLPLRVPPVFVDVVLQVIAEESAAALSPSFQRWWATPTYLNHVAPTEHFNPSIARFREATGFPTVEMFTSLEHGLCGRHQEAIETSRSFTNGQDWLYGPGEFAVWRVLSLMLALAASDNRREPIPLELRAELEVAVRGALDSEYTFTAREFCLMAVASIASERQSLMLRTAAALLDAYPDDPLARRMAAGAFGYGGHTEFAIELLDEIPEGNERRGTLREDLLRDPMLPLLFKYRPELQASEVDPSGR